MTETTNAFRFASPPHEALIPSRPAYQTAELDRPHEASSKSKIVATIPSKTVAPAARWHAAK